MEHIHGLCTLTLQLTISRTTKMYKWDKKTIYITTKKQAYSTSSNKNSTLNKMLAKCTSHSTVELRQCYKLATTLHFCSIWTINIQLENQTKCLYDNGFQRSVAITRTTLNKKYIELQILHHHIQIKTANLLDTFYNSVDISQLVIIRH